MVSVRGNQTNNKVTASPSTSTNNRAEVKPVNINNQVEATNNLAKYYSEVSQDWAVGEGLIQGIDYSSKTYALQSKEYANDAKESMEITEEYMDNAISNIQTAETNALSNIVMQEESALSTVNQGVEQLSTTITEGLDSINTSVTSGVETIETLQANSLAEITTNKESALSDIDINKTNTLAQISTLANTSISDINAVGKSYDNLTYRNITNCLLEIPQRIKYTLEDGTLTIKKGTVVIVPYGTTSENFTRVGSPTIVDGVLILDGVSNRQNYISANLSSLGYIDSFELELPINIGQIPTTADASICYITDPSIGQFCQINILRAGEIRVLLRDATSDTYWNILNGVLVPSNVVNNNLGKDIICVLKYKEGVFERGYKLDGNYYSFGVTNYTLKNSLNFTRADIGMNTLNVPSYAGSIDLKQFSITVDDKVVYRPYIQKGDRFLNDNFKVYDTQYTEDAEGNGKFFVWAEFVEDRILEVSSTATNGSRCIAIDLENAILRTNSIDNYIASGTESINGLCYRTDLNFVEHCDASIIKDYVSCFPFVLITIGSDRRISSVDQVFNGMGYIGSTVWVDKGVKGLIPNGRNEDGTLNNIEIVTNEIAMSTSTSTQDYTIRLSSNGKLAQRQTRYNLTVKTLNELYALNASVAYHVHVVDENRNYYTSNSQWNVTTDVRIITATLTNGVVSNFNPKQPFRITDNAVSKSGDTMTGPLVINTNEDDQLRNLSLRFSSVDFATPPSSAIYPNLEFQDGQGRRMGRVEYTYKPDGSHYISINDKKNANTASYALLYVGYDANGNAISSAPACAATNSIVTTTGISKASNGYVKLGNGIIIQWGATAAINVTNTTTVTFPTSFNAVPSVIPICRQTTGELGEAATFLGSVTKTKFVAYLERHSGSGTDGGPINWIAIGY